MATENNSGHAKSGYAKSHESVTQQGSALKKYQQVIIGKVSWSAFLYYEFCCC